MLTFVRIIRGNEAQVTDGDELQFQHTNGQRATLKATAKGWQPQGVTDQDFIRGNEADLRLMAALYAALIELPRLHASINDPGNRSTQEREPQTNASCPCTGAWVRSDSIYGSARSIACMAATSNLHGYKCTNEWCWGCCNLWWDCDCYCAVGDYMCFCTRSGQQCGGPCY